MSYQKFYEAHFIKEISGNRFILVSNYGYKIYSLNKKKEYAIVLLEEYIDGIDNIIELDKNNFIFLSTIGYGQVRRHPPHNRLIIDKISLKEISENEKNIKLEKIEERDYYNEEDSFYDYYSDDDECSHKNPPKKYSGEKIKNLIESLEYTHITDKLLDYSTYGSYHYFKGNAILMNKFFVVAIYYIILKFYNHLF